MLATLLEVCWWVTRTTCVGLWDLTMGADPTSPLRAELEKKNREIWRLENKVIQLEEISVDDFDILPVTVRQ